MTKTANQTKKVTGILEISDRGHGFLRDNENNLRIIPADPFVSRDDIKNLRLREGLLIDAVTEGKRGTNHAVKEITAINGYEPDHYIELTNFDDFTVIDPDQMIRLETGPEPLGMRVMDLLTPVGKGQRGLIVAPPRTGKTILLQQIANGITTNHPEIDLVVLLVDERPEEVTDMRRNIKGQVLASSNDKDVESHVRIARLALEKVKRQVVLE